MLTRTELVELERSLRGDRVLSVYIDGTEMNAAAKDTWQLDLAHSLRDLRARLDGSPHAERQAFDRCVNLLERELDAFAGAEIAAAARQGTSAMRDAFNLARIVEIVAHANGGAVTALGPSAAREALAEKRVRELYLTHRYLEHYPSEGESAVRSALVQGATVEEVSHAAAGRLDEYGGIAARLRYATRHRQAR